MKNNIENSPNFRKGIAFAMLPALSVLALPTVVTAEEVTVDSTHELTVEFDEQPANEGVITVIVESDVDSEVETEKESDIEANDAVDAWFDEETNEVIPTDEAIIAPVEDWFEPIVNVEELDSHTDGGEDEGLLSDGTVLHENTGDILVVANSAVESEAQVEAVIVEESNDEPSEINTLEASEDSVETLEVIGDAPIVPEPTKEIIQITTDVMRSEFDGVAGTDTEGDLTANGFMAVAAYGTAGTQLQLKGEIAIPAGHGDEKCVVNVDSENNPSVRPNSNAHFIGAGADVSILDVESTAGAVNYTSGSFTPDNEGGVLNAFVTLGYQDTQYGIHGANSFIARVTVNCDTPTPVVEVPVEETPTPVVEVPVEETPTPVVEVPVEETPVIEEPIIVTPIVETPTPIVEVPVPVVTPPKPELPPTGSETSSLVTSGLGLAVLGGWLVSQSNKAKKLAIARNR